MNTELWIVIFPTIHYSLFTIHFLGGPDRIRTGDLSIANAALYQLSYRPGHVNKKPRLICGATDSTPWGDYTRKRCQIWFRFEYGWLLLMNWNIGLASKGKYIFYRHLQSLSTADKIELCTSGTTAKKTLKKVLPVADLFWSAWLTTAQVDEKSL